MGPPKNLFRDFALAFWKTARDDLGRAQDAMEEGAYSYVIFHSQQCVEKVVKALLELKEVFSRDHDISDLFVLYFTEIEASIALSRAMSVFSEITSILKKEYKLEIIE